MTRRAALRLALVTAGALLALVVWRAVSPEARVRRVFADIAEAVSGEKLLALATHLSRRWSDPYGGSYESILGMAADVFATYDDLRFSHRVESVQFSGATAVVELTFRLYGRAEGKDGLILGKPLEPARARLLLRDERGSWLIEEVQQLDVPNAPPARTSGP